MAQSFTQQSGKNQIGQSDNKRITKKHNSQLQKPSIKYQAPNFGQAHNDLAGLT